MFRGLNICLGSNALCFYCKSIYIYIFDGQKTSIFGCRHESSNVYYILMQFYANHILIAVYLKAWRNSDIFTDPHTSNHALCILDLFTAYYLYGEHKEWAFCQFPFIHNKTGQKLWQGRLIRSQVWDNGHSSICDHSVPMKNAKMHTKFNGISFWVNIIWVFVCLFWLVSCLSTDNRGAQGG